MASSLYLFALIASTIMLNGINAAEDYQTEALNAHNEYRSWHEADDLIMDDELNKAAKKCAEYYMSKQTIDHTCPYKGDAGENLFYFSMSDAQPGNKDAAQRASKVWYDEIKDYNFNSPGFDFATGHFTQLVWKDTKRLGFGAAGGNNLVFATALYMPPGNYNNAFPQNVVAKTQTQASGHKNVTASSAASGLQINLNTCNTVVIYSVAICYTLLNLSQ